jgi:serine/threonine protein kinase
MCGSPQYVAPEIYQHAHGYGEKCDLWSAGVVIFVILGGYAPFEAPEDELPGLICHGRFKFDDPEWTDISVKPKLLIKRLLVVDPDERASIEEALDSEWLMRRDKELAKQHCSSMDGFSTSIAFDAWVKLSKSSNHSIARYANGVLGSQVEGQEEDEFGGDDSLSVDELNTSLYCGNRKK